jgi:hypothetical protein
LWLDEFLVSFEVLGIYMYLPYDHGEFLTWLYSTCEAVDTVDTVDTTESTMEPMEESGDGHNGHAEDAEDVGKGGVHQRNMRKAGGVEIWFS